MATIRGEGENAKTVFARNCWAAVSAISVLKDPDQVNSKHGEQVTRAGAENSDKIFVLVLGGAGLKPRQVTVEMSDGCKRR